jgi:hypothetical protein
MPFRLDMDFDPYNKLVELEKRIDNLDRYQSSLFMNQKVLNEGLVKLFDAINAQQGTLSQFNLELQSMDMAIDNLEAQITMLNLANSN